MTQALDPLTFPLTGSRLIEASAGTGKTYTIATLYLRLILQHGGEAAFPERLLPPQILVMTFTEAATQELRDRIRARLVEAANAFREPERPCDALLKALRGQCEPSSWNEQAWRLDAAAQWMDESAVMTIHAWCQRMLREHAFDSGSLFDLTVRTNHQELYDQVVRDYWRIHCYPLRAEAAEWVHKHWKHPGELWKLLKVFLTQMEVGLPNEVAPDQQTLQVWFDRLKTEIDTRLRSLKQRAGPWLDEVRCLLNEAREQKRFPGNRFNRKHQKDLFDKCQAWLDEPAQILIGLTSNQAWRLSVEGLRDLWHNPDEVPHLESLHELGQLNSQLKELQKKYQYNPLWHAISWTRQRFITEKRQRAEMGFVDMLLDLRHALHGPSGPRLAATIARQFPVAMVDEFQDTDPIQYEILDTVYSLVSPTPQNALILIGDPKQSIYGFRGADIHAYLRARRATQGRHYTLPVNYRSSAAMVAAVNHLFNQAEQRQQGRGAFLFRSAADGQAMVEAASNPLPFYPVQAHHTRLTWERNGVVQPALTFWFDADIPDDWEAADSCASAIVALLNDTTARYRDQDGQLHKPTSGDIAVLVRNRYEAQAIRYAMSRRGLRSVYLSSVDSVYQSQEALDMQFWLAACLQPQDERALKTALATPTLGLSLSELDRYQHDEHLWEEVVMQFTGYEARWRMHGVLPMLRQLIHDFELPQRLMREPQEGERVLTNVLHLAEVLQRQAREVDGQRALLQFLQQARAEPDSIDDQQIIRLESDETLLRIVTTHKSKGLEYPFVFLPFINRYKVFRSQNGFVLSRNGQRGFHLYADKEDALFRQAESARLAEDLRLLYVALTRARYACWLGVEKPKDELSEHDRGSALTYLLGAQSIDDLPMRLESIVADAAQQDTTQASLALQSFPDISPTRHYSAPIVFEPQPRVYLAPPREPWWVASYSALRTTSSDVMAIPQTAAAQVLADDEPRPVLPLDHLPQPGMHQLPRGAAIGNFLHDLLERVMLPENRSRVTDPAERAAMVEQLASRYGYDEWLDVLTPWLDTLWHTDFALPEGQLFSLSALTSWKVEMEFWFSAHQVDTLALHEHVIRHVRPGEPRPSLVPERLNGLFKGFIDLIFEVGGRYYVLDYKSNYLGPDDNSYQMETMWGAMLSHRYDLQYVLYTLALHRHLKSRLPDYDYDQHVGGMVYLFLRGIQGPAQGIVTDRLPRPLIDALDALFVGSTHGEPA